MFRNEYFRFYSRYTPYAFTEQGIYTLPSARISSQDINNFNAQYPTLTIKKIIAFHDWFLIIDGVEGYHI